MPKIDADKFREEAVEDLQQLDKEAAKSMREDLIELSDELNPTEMAVATSAIAREAISGAFAALKALALSRKMEALACNEEPAPKRDAQLAELALKSMLKGAIDEVCDSPEDGDDVLDEMRSRITEIVAQHFGGNDG